ncbi:porin [uncultured Caulobacter sp.]|uniref:OprO/OprP family phosphate-selective porin n=1 Tax=uncultured Caulobacter sp. TaxID=158749 RepID=UPI00261529D5|nr:porin [uncultured Caulobacter sp.]
MITKTVLRTGLVAAASLLATAAAAQTASPPPASPEEAAARIAALEAQLAVLQQQVADLKAATAASLKDVRAVQAAQPVVSLASGKPTITSSDGAFSINFHALMQLDAAQYYQAKGLPAVDGNARDLNSGTNFRRARLGFDGKLYKNFDYGVLFEFGGNGTDGQGTLQELWVQYNYAPFKFKVGAFIPNLGLEDSAPVATQLFPERPAPAELARNLAGADKRIAFQVQTAGERWLLSGAVTGAKTGDGQTFDEQLGYVGRAVYLPIKTQDWLVHVGANASVVVTPAQTAVGGPYPITFTERPELRVDGTALINTGAIDALGAHHYGVEGAVQHGNLMVQGEYFDLAINRRNPADGVTNPKFKAWYLEGSWVLTGEARRYTSNFVFDAPSVAKPFDPKKGQWGAWELAARYSVSDLNYHENAALAADRVRGGDQKIASVGLNWFPNPATKFSLSYYDVSLDRLDPAGGAVPLSQDYQVINLRSQYAF